jgi:hypothetical protein
MRWDPLQRLFLVYSAGGGGDAPTSTTNTTQLYSPEEAARRAKVMAEAERIYGRTSGAGMNMPGPAPSADTLQAQQMMRQLATGGWSDIAGQMPQAFNFGMQAAMNPTAAPGFADVLGTATRQVGEAFTGPKGPFANIRSGFTAGSSGGSGTREGIAMGMAGRDYLNTIGDVTGRLTSDAYRTGLDTFGRTLALSPQMMQTAGMPAAGVGQVGQQVEGYEQQAREWELQAPWAAFGPYANVVSGMSGPSGTSSTATGSSPRANPMAPLGAAMMGASMGAAVPAIGPWVGAGAGLLLSLWS